MSANHSHNALHCIIMTRSYLHAIQYKENIWYIVWNSLISKTLFCVQYQYPKSISYFSKLTKIPFEEKQWGYYSALRMTCLLVSQWSLFIGIFIHFDFIPMLSRLVLEKARQLNHQRPQLRHHQTPNHLKNRCVRNRQSFRNRRQKRR